MMLAHPAAMLCRLCVIVIFAAALFTGRTEPFAADEFPFEFREGLLWVEVRVPQSERPLQFLVDTGAGVSVLHLATAKRLSLKLGRKVVVQGVGAVLPGYWQESLSAKVGGISLPKECLVVDLEKLSASCECPVDGLVGVDFFRGRVVQIDFMAQKIRLLKSADVVPSGEVLPLQVRSCGMRVPITVNGLPRQWVRLDTGCVSALQWVTSTVRLEQCSNHSMAIGLAEISVPQADTAVGIGNLEFKQVPTGLHRKAIFPGEAGLLGNALLARFPTVTIDAKAGRLILQKPLPSR